MHYKVLAVEEEKGAEEADYGIRNLITSNELVIESTIKDAVTGKMTTITNTVKCNTAVFKTTTNPETDPETNNPTEKIILPKLGHRLPENILTEEEMRKLLAAPDKTSLPGKEIRVFCSCSLNDIQQITEEHFVNIKNIGITI
ncbi:MAG: hypothetical protein ACMUIP_02040 [bacterium]